MASSFQALVKSFARDERGASFVEYSVLTALMVAVIVAAIGVLGTDMNGLFTRISAVLGGVDPSATPGG